MNVQMKARSCVKEVRSCVARAVYIRDDLSINHKTVNIFFLRRLLYKDFPKRSFRKKKCLKSLKDVSAIW